MNKIRIGTWNITNSYFNLNKTNQKVVAITELLTRANLDILALQEVNSLLLSKLESELGLCYHHVDRYLNLNNPIMPTVLDNHNILIINNDYINNTDILKLKNNSKLADILSLRHKYVSKVYIQNEKNLDFKFNLYNVNLDSNPSAINTQIDSLANIINDDNRLPMIIVGNLNFSSSSIEAARLLNNNKLKMIDIGKKTYKYSDDIEAIDHIIVLNDSEIEEINVVKDYANVSLHYPVIAKVKVR